MSGAHSASDPEVQNRGSDPLVPNPGSVAAVERGCTCPVMDNNRGLESPWPSMIDEGGGWWLASDCPLHGLDRPTARGP